MANPGLSFPLTGGKAVGKTLDASGGQSHTAHLTRRLAAGDEAAFREFHAQYFGRLYRFLLVATRGQEQDAQEALQQTLLRVVRYARRFDSEEVFWGWLKAVARSAARDANRRQRRYLALLHRFACRPESAGGSVDEGGLLSGLVEESLIELAEEDRRLLEAKYIEGFTVKELSRKNGLSEKGIESRLERLRRTIRERVLRKLR